MRPEILYLIQAVSVLKTNPQTTHTTSEMRLKFNYKQDHSQLQVGTSALDFLSGNFNDFQIWKMSENAPGRKLDSGMNPYFTYSYSATSFPT